MNLIVGIDPGTTTGFACLDLNGKLISTGSERQLGKDQLVRLLSESGSPLIVGCDKHNIPGLVESVAAQFGAVIHAPQQDTLASDKRELTQDVKTANVHELDAIASARLAYNAFAPVIQRTYRKLEAQGKEAFFDKVIVLVIKHKLSITGAVLAVEQPALPRVQALRQVIAISSVKTRNIVQLYNDAVLFEHANTLLKQKLKEVQDQLAKAIRTNTTLQTKMDSLSVQKAGVRLLHQESRIAQLRKERDTHQFSLRKEQQLIENIFYQMQKRMVHISPRLKTFATHEPCTMLARDAVVFVQSVSSASPKIHAMLSHLRALVCEVLPSAAIREQLPIPCILADSTNVFYYKNWVCIDCNWLSDQLQKTEVFHKVIEEYKKERAINSEKTN